ncbi:MAG: hypothetical protein FWH12_02340 [Treponema sp.]|nr:hypothetical protein [Treponema sp.]
MKFIMRTTYERKVDEYPKDIPGLIFSTISERSGYKNFQNALSIAGDDSAVHMEDDIILCADFYNRIKIIVNERPNDIIQFFSGTRSDDQKKGTRYETGAKFLWAQCFYLPPGMSKEMYHFSLNWKDRDNKFGGWSDVMVADYFKMKKRKYLVVVPSLVDHMEGKSLIDPRRSSKRQSKTFKMSPPLEEYGLGLITIKGGA